MNAAAQETTDTSKKSDVYRRLQSQLSQFGLNPLHWKIKRDKKRFAKVIDLELYHYRDPNYRLSGTAEFISNSSAFKKTACNTGTGQFADLESRPEQGSAMWREIRSSFDF